MQASKLVQTCRQGALTAKLDLKDGACTPVGPTITHYWEGIRYCDQALPFGLKSAPKIFTAVAE